MPQERAANDRPKSKLQDIRTDVRLSAVLGPPSFTYDFDMHAFTHAHASNNADCDSTADCVTLTQPGPEKLVRPTIDSRKAISMRRNLAGLVLLFTAIQARSELYSQSAVKGLPEKATVPSVTVAPDAIMRKGDAEPPVIYIVTTNPMSTDFDPSAKVDEHELSRWEPVRVVLLIWKDGTAIWSEDRVKGGAPYSLGYVDPAKIQGFTRTLEEKSYLNQEALNRYIWIAPHESYTLLGARGSKDELLQILSRHEIAETTHPEIVVTSEATVPREMGKAKEQVIAEKDSGNYSSEYLYMRGVWNEVKPSAMDLIPPTRTKVLGSDDFKIRLRLVEPEELPSGK